MTKQLGNAGEELVKQYLKQQGFVILEQNYAKFYGEIDIIARNKDTICFVEVKTRRSNKVSLHYSITKAKQNKIIAVAQSYIANKGRNNLTYRFDVALIYMNNNIPELTYIPNAFCAE